MPKKARHGEHDDTISHSQILDETFECMKRTAQSMCVTLGRPKDRIICRQTLSDLSMYHKSESTKVKYNVRRFLRFYLKALRWTQINQPMPVYEKWFGDSCHDASKDPSLEPEDEIHVWIENGRSYLAMKHFEDGSTMIYSAVSHEPSAGWVDGGLKKLFIDSEH